MSFYSYKTKKGHYEVWKNEENLWSVNVVNYSLIKSFQSAGYRLKREAIQYAKEIMEVE